MKKEEMENFVDNLQKKLGKENSAIISDDIATLISDNSNMNKTINEKDENILKLKQEKEILITSNGNLLQKVAMSEKDEEDFPNNNTNEKKKEEKPFSFYSAFDEKGNFIK